MADFASEVAPAAVRSLAMIDRWKAWNQIGARIEVTASARHRAMLECVREHIIAETEADLDRLMATLCADPKFHFWVAGNGNGTGPKGIDAVWAHYRTLVAERRNVFEIDIERIVVDDATVVTEGWFHQVFPGSTLVDRGVDIDDPNAAYVVTMRLLLLWPFTEDGELIGEDSYAGSVMFAPGSVNKLAPEDIPAEFS